MSHYLTSFPDRAAGQKDESEAVNVLYLDIEKGF